MIPQTLGGRLRQLRKERGLDQGELARILGYTRAIISYWETGTRIPSLFAATTIAQSLNISLDYLIRGIKDDGK